MFFGLSFLGAVIARVVAIAPVTRWMQEPPLVRGVDGSEFTLDVSAASGLYLIIGGRCLECYQYMGAWRALTLSWPKNLTVLATAAGEETALGQMLGGHELIGHLDDSKTLEAQGLSPPILAATAMGRIVYVWSRPPKWLTLAVLHVLIDAERRVRRWGL